MNLPADMKTHMTLRELMERISPTAGVSIPTPRQLRLRCEIVDTYEADDCQITVYKSGFATAQVGKHWAVIRVDKCGDYTYRSTTDTVACEEGATPYRFDAEYFLDHPWPIRLLIKADDQITANQNKHERRLLSEHPEIPDDKKWMLGGYCSFEDALLNRMDMEERLGAMTEKQREIFILYYKYGYTQMEIAEMLGIRRASVSDRLIGALKKLRKQSHISQ